MSANSHFVAITKTVIVIGFILGLVISWNLISGDEQGRVNILHLLAVYILLPVVSLFISALSLSFGNGINLTTVISRIPIFGYEISGAFLRAKQQQTSKLFFFYQSQLAAISFSFASLLVLIILLISSDVNFVWRSTLLDAEFVHTLLEWLAMPWKFWDAAQPSLEILQLTQDSRLVSSRSGADKYAQWWQYIFASQLFYAFFLRGIAIIICRSIMHANSNQHLLKVTKKNSKRELQPSSFMDKEGIKGINVVTRVKTDYALNNWSGIDNRLILSVEKNIQKMEPNIVKTIDLEAGPLVSQPVQLASERWQEPQLLVVKGWEPPLAELSDFMENGKGYLLPVDYDGLNFNALDESYLQEWHDFIQSLPRWQLLQLELFETDASNQARPSEENKCD